MNLSNVSLLLGFVLFHVVFHVGGFDLLGFVFFLLSVLLVSSIVEKVSTRTKISSTYLYLCRLNTYSVKLTAHHSLLCVHLVWFTHCKRLLHYS